MHITSTKILVNSLLILVFLSSIQTHKATEFIGKWKAEGDEKVSVEIYQAQDGLYYGKAIDSHEKKGKEGHLMFQKCRYDATTKTLIGTMHPPDRPIDLELTIQIEKNGKMKTTARKFIMSTTLYFIKVN